MPEPIENAGQFIPLAEAREMDRAYREYEMRITGKGPDQITRAHFFGRNQLMKLLQKPGSVGIRMYQAIRGTDERHLVLVAVDAQGNDMISKSSMSSPATFDAATTEDTLDLSKVCPPFCDDGTSGL